MFRELTKYKDRDKNWWKYFSENNSLVKTFYFPPPSLTRYFKSHQVFTGLLKFRIYHIFPLLFAGSHLILKSDQFVIIRTSVI